jgi:hypothetical protein
MTTVPHWNFAFSHAVGEWQLLLCDDDAVVPDLLAMLDREIAAHPEVDSICWHYANCAEGGDPPAHAKLRLNIPDCRGARTLSRSDDIIRRMFECGTGLAASVKRDVPIAPASAYSRRVIEQIRTAWDGKLFLPICPMITCALAVLAYSDRVLRIDLPLTVLGQTTDSAAGHLQNGDTYRRMHAGVSFAHAPIRSMSVFPSVTLESLLYAQAALPAERVGQYRPDRVRYFVDCEQAIEEIARTGYDASELRRQWTDALAVQSDEVRRMVAGRIADARDARNRDVPRRRVAGAVASILRRVGLSRDGSTGRSLDATRLGLRNIGDCANYLAALRQ